jgi:hypothetical protein
LGVTTVAVTTPLGAILADLACRPDGTSLVTLPTLNVLDFFQDVTDETQLPTPDFMTQGQGSGFVLMR